jgi:hypothetical protein
MQNKLKRDEEGKSPIHSKLASVVLVLKKFVARIEEYFGCRVCSHPNPAKSANMETARIGGFCSDPFSRRWFPCLKS